MLSVAVIGYGYWGPNLVRNFASIKEARVAAVCDQRPERLESVRSLYPAVKTTTEYGEVLADSGIDAVVIATPVSSHYSLASAALKAGKHVWLEKPMTASAEEAVRLIAEARQARLLLHVDHTFIYTGAVRKIRELVAGGEIGDVYYYDSARVNLGLFQHDVNVIWDLAVHDLSIVDYVLGARPIGVSATGVAHVNGNHANIAYLTLFFKNSLIAHFHVNWLAPVKLRQTLIGGSRKMIVWDDLEPSEKVKVYDKGITLSDDDSVHKARIGYRSGDMWAPKIDATEALRDEARHFADCVGAGNPTITDGYAGLRVVEIAEAATRSLDANGQMVRLELQKDAA